MRFAAVVWVVWLAAWVSLGVYGLSTQDRFIGALGFLAAVGWMIYGHWEWERARPDL